MVRRQLKYCGFARGNYLLTLVLTSVLQRQLTAMNTNGFDQTSGKRPLKLTDIPELCQSNCKIRDIKVVEEKLNDLVDFGTQRLQVVSDFDFTITRQHYPDGSQVLASFGIFDKCKSLPSWFREETDKLHKKYRPIEIDPHLPIDEKTKYMIEWWNKTGNLLKGFKFDMSDIDEAAKLNINSLRENTKQLFEDLFQLNVPVLVFSAGLGDVVKAVLNETGVLFPNVKIISNFLQYKDGVLDGFQDHIIHVFNKNETALNGTEYYDLVHDRDHIIVMGDSLGDAGMADGVPSTSHVLKIGFLYDHPEDNLPAYMNNFDIVLVDDQTMNVPLAIIKQIAANSKARNIK